MNKDRLLKRFREDIYNEGSILACINYNNEQLKQKILKILKQNAIL
jgi:hypothetical protein